MKVILPEEVTFKLLTRADGMYAEGYRVTEIVGDLYCMTSPDGAQYEVDTRDRTCTCVSFQRGKYRDSQDRLTCKHLISARKIFRLQQDEAAQMKAIDAAFSKLHYLEGRSNILQGVTR